ncbi:MAG: tRNA (adenosine(37)-N6)-dimethylallyltransferase MiaA [Patescibacteria group bacterium]
MPKILKVQKAAKLTEKFLAGKPTKPVLVVLGPTASGKTDFAIKLAQKLRGEIVNCDSRQIYRELDIGSARPTDQEMKLVPHHLVGIFSPRKVVSVAAYRKLAEKKIREILNRKKLPILAGGHTLLLSAIIENFRFPGKADLARRAALEKIWLKNPQKLWEKLRKSDPNAAAKIPPENRHHLIRALERAENAEKPTHGKRKFDFLIFGIATDREKLYARIDRRVGGMLRAGLLSEVESLAKKFDRYSPALRGHGYREILDFLHGEKTWETAIEEIKRDTRNYAKRQTTWLRNCSFANEIIWI